MPRTRKMVVAGPSCRLQERISATRHAAPPATGILVRDARHGVYVRLEKGSWGDSRHVGRQDMEKEHMDITKKQYLKIREDVVGFRAF